MRMGGVVTGEAERVEWECAEEATPGLGVESSRGVRSGRVKGYWWVAWALAVGGGVLAPTAAPYFSVEWQIHRDMGINAYNGLHAVTGMTLHRELPTSYPGGMELAWGAILRVFGPRLEYLYLPAAILAGLNVLLAAGIARHLASDRWGIWAMAWVLASGPLVTYSGYPAWYAVTLGLAALWAVLEFNRGGRVGWLIVAGLLVGLAAVAKHSVAAFYLAWLGAGLVVTRAVRPGSPLQHRAGRNACPTEVREGGAAGVGTAGVSAGRNACPTAGVSAGRNACPTEVREGGWRGEWRESVALWISLGGLAGIAGLWLAIVQRYLDARTLAAFVAVPAATLIVLGAWLVRAYRRAGGRLIVEGIKLAGWMGAGVALPVVALAVYLVSVGAGRAAVFDLLERPWIFSYSWYGSGYPLSVGMMALLAGLVLSVAALVRVAGRRAGAGGSAWALWVVTGGAVAALVCTAWGLATWNPGARELVKEAYYFLPLSASALGLAMLAGYFRAGSAERDEAEWRRVAAVVLTLGMGLASFLTAYPLTVIHYLCYSLPFLMLVVAHAAGRMVPAVVAGPRLYAAAEPEAEGQRAGGDGDVATDGGRAGRWGYPVQWVCHWALPALLVVMLILPHFRAESVWALVSGSGTGLSLLDERRARVWVERQDAEALRPVVQFLRGQPEREAVLMTLDGWLIAFLADRRLPVDDMQAELHLPDRPPYRYRLAREDAAYAREVFERVLRLADERGVEIVVTDVDRLLQVRERSRHAYERLMSEFGVALVSGELVVFDRRAARGREAS